MENNKIAKVETMHLDEIMTMSKAFAESGMFTDMKTAAQAFVKIQAGQEIGIPPFASMTGIHMIQGKPTIGANLIASRVKGSMKYDYKIVKHDEKICSIDFYQGKEKIGNSTFTIEEATKAGTKNLEKFPKNMLFARAISNGVKWFCPDIFSGPVYTPEEIEDVEAIEITTGAKVNIADPAVDTPPLTIDDTAYRTATNDAELITNLIDNATEPGLLKTFYAVNAKFFKSNTELEERLKQKGIALKKAIEEKKHSGNN